MLAFLQPNMFLRTAASITYTLYQLRSGHSSLKLEFPTTNVTVPGINLSKVASSVAPSLWIQEDAIKSLQTKYISVCLDLDAPFPLTPTLSPILHEIQADLQVSGEADDEGWVHLTTDADPVVPYLAPSPPRLSSAHRYLFMLWEQPEGLSSLQIKDALRLPNNAGLLNRIRWDEDRCERRVGLDQVLVGNYFTCG